MELLIALLLSAVPIALYSAGKWFWDSHRQMQQSLIEHEAVSSAIAKLNAEQPRLLVHLGHSFRVTGWAPCQRVEVPAGEYVAYLSKFTHDARVGAEDSICFVDVPQQWNGESMKRDVFVRIADYPSLFGFPKINDARHIKVLSNNLSIRGKQAVAPLTN